jgi:DNA polymerase elongation subunit (family B)
MKFKDPHLGYELAYCPDKLPEKIDMIIDPSYSKKEVVCTRDQLSKKIKDSKLIHTINGCFFLPHEKEKSIFNEILDSLMTSRKKYKGKMFEAIERDDKIEEDYYDTRQLVYKVLANTLYGVIANKSYRFFDTALAAAVTLGGQEALKTSIIEGDAFMKHLDTEEKYKQPPTLTKEEMFAKPSTLAYKMPNRSHEYIVTGDTDSIFCCFERFKQEKTVKRIKEWCELIQNFLNNERIPEVVKRHNVNLDINRLSLKNELVISRGLFLAKKRYAIRVINNEGEDVDKIKYMGVEIKRSDYPSKSKEFLSELTELILKSETVSLSKLLGFVKRKEVEFVKSIKVGDKSIARPVSWGKDLKLYKTIPQAVKAMIAWNEIMYDIHKPGAKAYMYRVSGIDPLKAPPDVLKKYEIFISNGNKLEVIAVPDEEASLPNFFVPNVKANLKFCFQDRYELMLKPLLDVKKQMEVLTI